MAITSQTKYPDPEQHASDALKDYFSWAKGNWGIADFLAQCTETEIPQWIKDACANLQNSCTSSDVTESMANSSTDPGDNLDAA